MSTIRATPASDRPKKRRSPYGSAASTVVAALVSLLFMAALSPPVRAATPTTPADVGPLPPIDSPTSFDGTFSGGLRRQMWNDPGPHGIIVNGAPTVVAVPAGAHDSLEVDLTIDQGDGYADGSYGVFLDVAVTAHMGTPAAGDWVGIFQSQTANSTERSDDVRVTWDHRVAPSQVMDLHVKCYTWDDPNRDGCAIANIRGFEDTPGGWDPVVWNGPTEHGFGVYAGEMPLVVGDKKYGPRITADGPDNPFLGVERSLGGGRVILRGPLVTLPTFTQTAPLSASIRWRRTTNAVNGEQTFTVPVKFMPIDDREQTLLAIPPGSTSTLDWQTQESGPLRTRLSGKVGHFFIEPDGGSLGPIQAVGVDSLTFYLNGQPVDIPLTPCTPGPNNVVIYEHTYYQGRCVVRGIDTYGSPPFFTPVLDNSASSIRVGAKVEAVLARDNGVTGVTELFAGDDHDFRNNATLGDDTMSSFTVRARTVEAPCTEGTISFGEIRAVGCFTHPEPTVWQATGTVRMNGIDLTTAGTITLDAAGPSLSVEGQVEVSVGEGDSRMELFAAAGLQWDLSVELKLALPENFKLKGFDVTGEATLTWTEGKVEVAVEVGLPGILGDITGGAGFSASVEDGLQLDSFSIKVGKAKLGPLELKDLSIKYESENDEGTATDIWTGGGTVVLPGVEVEVEVVFTAGEFTSGTLKVGDLNKPIGGGVFLQSIDARVNTKPDFQLGGGADITAGPEVLDTRRPRWRETCSTPSPTPTSSGSTGH